MTCEAPLPNGNRSPEGLCPDEKHYTPGEVYALWKVHLNRLRGSEAEIEAAHQIVRLFQPPICFDDLQYCLRVYLALNPHAQAAERPLAEVIEPLRHSMARRTTRMDRPHQRYPLFKTLKAIYQLDEALAYRDTRARWLLALTHQWPRYDYHIERHAWYSSMLDIRTVVLEADPTVGNGDAALEHLQAHLLRFQLATQKSERLTFDPTAAPEPISAQSLLYRRAVKVVQFIQGTTFPGRMRASSNPKKRLKGRKLVEGIQEHVDKAAKKAREANADISTSGAFLDRPDAGRDSIQADIDRQLRKPRGSKRKGRSSGTEDELCLSEFFTLPESAQGESARDMSAQVGRSSAAQATRNIRSTADVTCHTRKRLLYLLPLIADQHPRVAIACLISWTLGLSIKRIENVSTRLQTPLTAANAVLNRQTGCLRYLIEHHPQGDDGVFEIELPNEWIGIVTQTPEEQPFKTLKAEYTQVITQLIRSPLERAVKITEWASSSSTFDEGDFPGVISAIKRGRLTRRYITSAHYLQVDLAQVATRLRAGWDRLLSDIQRDTKKRAELFAGSHWTFSSAPVHQHLGSHIYGQLGRWQQFYTALNTVYQRVLASFPKTDPTNKLNAFVRLWNLNQLQALWQHQFYTVSRPLGPLTQSELYNGMLYHRDKASGEYEERKAFELRASEPHQLHPLALQHAALAQQVEALIDITRSMGWHVSTHTDSGACIALSLNLPAKPRTHLPSALVWCEQRQTLTLSLMTPAEVVKILEREDELAEFSDLPLNIFRHVVETECIWCLGQNRTDMMLGHVHPGADAHGRDSSARFTDFAPINAWLNRRAKELQISYDALPMDRLQRGLQG